MDHNIFNINELSNKNRRLLQAAKKLAATSKYGTFKHGAILTSGSCIIGLGVNNEKYTSIGSKHHPTGNSAYSTYHAEIVSVLNLPRHVTKGSTIYVARTSKCGNEFRMSKPCEMCHAVLEERGVKKVFFSIDENTVGWYKL